MLTSFLKGVLPHRFVRSGPGCVIEQYSLRQIQQEAHRQFDSLCLALGVLEFGGDPGKQAEWLLRVAEAADKCATAIDKCIEQSAQPM